MEAMARATAEHYRTPQPIIEELSLENANVNHYVWYAGEDLPWPEIKGGFIRRCRVTPIVPFFIWERINDVPVDMRKALRRDWMDREHQEAKYEIPPQGIFESVTAQYGGLGLVELTALIGMEEQRVAALNLDVIFAPWDEIPKPYQTIEDHIQQTLSGMRDPALLSVGRDMLESIRKSRAYDMQFLDTLESQKELKYSHPAYRALDRLGRRRRDHALNDLASAEIAAKSAAAQASSDNSALVAEMAEQNRLKREELELRREELELNRKMMAKGKPNKRGRIQEPVHAE